MSRRAAAGVIAVVVALSGCSGADGGAAEPAPTVTVTVTETATAPPTGDQLAACQGAVRFANEGFNRAGEAFGIASEMTRAMADVDAEAHDEASDRFRTQTESAIQARDAFDTAAAVCLGD